jgi:hypothetical protein
MDREASSHRLEASRRLFRCRNAPPDHADFAGATGRGGAISRRFSV